jgi:hypothetical protein
VTNESEFASYVKDEEGKNEMPLMADEDDVKTTLQRLVIGLDNLKVNKIGMDGEVEILGVVSTNLRVLQHSVENNTALSITISIGI